MGESKKRTYKMIPYAFREVYTLLGVVSAFMTVICIVDINAIFPELYQRVLLVCGIFFMAFLTALVKVILTKRVQIDIGDGRNVCVQFGDLFAQEKRIVIPVNDSFDTEADDVRVAKNSVHGQFVLKFFNGKEDELKRLISEQLQQSKVRPIGSADEDKYGEKVQYPLGTTIMIELAGVTYYLVALTHFEGNVVKPDLPGFYRAVLSMFEYLNEHKSGSTVYLPLIGSGLARLGRNKQLQLENLITLMKMSSTPMMGGVNIILYEGDRGKINLQSIKE